jgi:transposase
VIQKNPYFRHSKVSATETRQIMRDFAMDLTATDCAELRGVYARSVSTIHRHVRQRLFA